MTNKKFTFELGVEIQDAGALHDAAKARLVKQGVDSADAETAIGTRELPNISGCLVMLLDPGSSIQGLSVLESGAYGADDARCADLPGAPIDATVTTDDCQRRVQFDARRWFADASADDIKALAAGNWGAGEASDPVADESQQWNQEVESLFGYIEAYNRNRGSADMIGYSVYIDGATAVAWLQAVRPDVYAELSAEGIA